MEGENRDLDILDVIKDSIAQDKKREAEYVLILNDQIDYLKSELKQKNLFIDELLILCKSAKNTPHETKVATSLELLLKRLLTKDCSNETLINQDCFITKECPNDAVINQEFNPECGQNEYNEWITNRTKLRRNYKNKSSSNNKVVLMNSFTPLSFQTVNNDEHECYDNDDNINYTSFQHAANVKYPSNRVYVNKFPERSYNL